MEYLVLLFTFLSRIFDGVEHGLHWYSSPRRNNGKQFHDADLYQTWASRGAYLVILYTIVGLQWTLAPIFIGLCMVDQAVWQIFLNKFAGNGWFSGELDNAEFTWWPTSGKLFANELRICQIFIGLGLVITGIFI